MTVKSDKNSIISDPGVQNILFDSIPQMLIILDENNVITWQNKKTTGFFGRVLTGESFKETFFLNPDELNNSILKALSTVSNKKGLDRILEHYIIKHPYHNKTSIKKNCLIDRNIHYLLFSILDL